MVGEGRKIQQVLAITNLAFYPDLKINLGALFFLPYLERFDESFFCEVNQGGKGIAILSQTVTDPGHTEASGDRNAPPTATLAAVPLIFPARSHLWWFIYFLCDSVFLSTSLTLN